MTNFQISVTSWQKTINKWNSFSESQQTRVKKWKFFSEKYFRRRLILQRSKVHQHNFCDTVLKIGFDVVQNQSVENPWNATSGKFFINLNCRILHKKCQFHNHIHMHRYVTMHPAQTFNIILWNGDLPLHIFDLDDKDVLFSRVVRWLGSRVRLLGWDIHTGSQPQPSTSQNVQKHFSVGCLNTNVLCQHS